MLEIEARDRELLDAIQNEIPLISTPWAAVGQVIDMSEKEVIKRVDKLRRAGVIQSIEGVFDARALGYASSLVAVAAPPDQIDKIASTINLHPAVTQNYQRNHRFNLWFSLLLPPGSRMGLEATAAALTEGADDVLVLPTEASYGPRGEELRIDPRELTGEEIQVVRILQKDLPGIPRPFDLLGRQNGIDAADILSTGARLRAEKRFLGYAGVAQSIRPRAFAAHVMAAWRAAEDVHDLARALAARPEIPRSWVRPTRPGWPYGVFTTVQGRSVDECQALVDAIAADLGVRDFVLMFPVKEYKHSRIEYFGDDLPAWENAQSSAAG